MNAQQGAQEGRGKKPPRPLAPPLCIKTHFDEIGGLAS
jgi:hypothetical protein